MPKLNITIEQRLWRKVDRSGECWLWTGRTDEWGYGIFTAKAPKRAHRVSWEVNRGPIPEGLSVLHRCDNPPCVRPDHLFLGTHNDNMRDAVSKGRLPVPMPGERNGQAKLTESQVRLIRAATGSNRNIAAQFNVTPEHAYRIRARKSWAHLE